MGRDSLMDMADPNPVLVLDTGTATIKAGNVREDGPKVLFSNVLGAPRHASPIAGFRAKQFYVGDEAVRRRGALLLEHPMERGRVVNWGAMEKVWRHLFFEELRANPADAAHCILLADTPLNPDTNRSKTVQVMFESFNAPAVYMAPQPVLAVYASGRTTGLVVHSGEGATVTMPVHEGYGISEAVRRVDMAGADISAALQEALGQAGYELGGAAGMCAVQRIKEKLCHLPSPDLTPPELVPYVLPDGGRVLLDTAMQALPEALFTSTLAGAGAQSLLLESLGVCDVHLRRALGQAVLLSGGNTLLPGYKERMLWHLQQAGLQGSKVLAPSERALSVWIGGSILGSLPGFRQMWISADDYHEQGPRVVHQKCF
eukprot:TRINITY_DN18182_c0_g1_i1.p1 TRINITY_DN18182_c0_g1~~TRINITY_DN18182_c0_g1_i1.p1  ORF type:complete len:373 (+),score=100.71 TRINITY_DN18182_c0_g1_i1:35-1153(+)